MNRLLAILCAVLVVCKLSGWIEWGWGWVLGPVLIPLLIQQTRQALRELKQELNE